MKIVLNKKALNVNPDRFLRKVGYAMIRDGRTGKISYARHLGRGRYPRLHMYFDETSEKVSFNLHLDQKHASYQGNHMHNAEYDGEVVETEINRLKNFLRLEKPELDSAEESISGDLLKNIGSGQIDNNIQKKKNWFQKLLKL